MKNLIYIDFKLFKNYNKLLRVTKNFEYLKNEFQVKKNLLSGLIFYEDTKKNKEFLNF